MAGFITVQGVHEVDGVGKIKAVGRRRLTAW